MNGGDGKGMGTKSRWGWGWRVLPKSAPAQASPKASELGPSPPPPQVMPADGIVGRNVWECFQSPDGGRGGGRCLLLSPLRSGAGRGGGGTGGPPPPPPSPSLLSSPSHPNLPVSLDNGMYKIWFARQYRSMMGNAPPGAPPPQPPDRVFVAVLWVKRSGGCGEVLICVIDRWMCRAGGGRSGVPANPITWIHTELCPPPKALAPPSTVCPGVR